MAEGLPKYPGEEIQRVEDALLNAARPEPKSGFRDWLRHAWLNLLIIGSFLFLWIGFIGITIYLKEWFVAILVFIGPLSLARQALRVGGLFREE